MEHDQQVIAEKAVALVNQYRDVSRKWVGHTKPPAKALVQLARLRSNIRLIGETAAFFGGYSGMMAVNDAIVEQGGCNSTSTRRGHTHLKVAALTVAVTSPSPANRGSNKQHTRKCLTHYSTSFFVK